MASTARMQAMLTSMHMTKPTSTNMGTHTISHMFTAPVAAMTIRIEPQQCAVIGLI